MGLRLGLKYNVKFRIIFKKYIVIPKTRPNIRLYVNGNKFYFHFSRLFKRRFSRHINIPYKLFYMFLFYENS